MKIFRLLFFLIKFFTFFRMTRAEQIFPSLRVSSSSVLFSMSCQSIVMQIDAENVFPSRGVFYFFTVPFISLFSERIEWNFLMMFDVCTNNYLQLVHLFFFETEIYLVKWKFCCHKNKWNVSGKGEKFPEYFSSICGTQSTDVNVFI